VGTALRRAESLSLDIITTEETRISEPRTNDRIRVPEVRLVGPAGEQVGVVKIEVALRLAQEAQQAHAEAEQALRAKNLFLSTASHDLRQPIHALGLFLTALRAMAQAPAVSTTDLAEICRRMQSSLDGLGQLLNMLLDVSRLDANAVQVERVPTPIAQIFVELDQDFAELALEKGLSLHVVSCSAWVHTDPTVLRRILSNLMSNAIRYTQRGRVVLGARPRGQQVEIQPEGDPSRVYVGTVLRRAAVFGARKLASDDPSQRSDERVVEVVVSAKGAPLLVGQRVLVKFMKPGQKAGVKRDKPTPPVAGGAKKKA